MYPNLNITSEQAHNSDIQWTDEGICNNVAGILLRPRDGRLGSRFLAGARDFLLSETSRTGLGLIELPI